MTIAELRRELSLRLDDPVDVRILLEEAAGERSATLVLRANEELAPERIEFARLALERRLAGEPLQHVVGHWPFRSLELIVDRRALIPRPETELVVERCLVELDRRAAPGVRQRCLDLGTGSGAIALSLAAERDLEVVATDVSAEALELARENCARLAADVARRVSFVQGSWYDALAPGDAGSFDLIVSNPPYLSLLEWDELEPLVREHDPKGALLGGELGTEAIAEVTAGASRYLRPGGALVVEIGWAQGPVAAQIARECGATEVELAADLAGRDRIFVAGFGPW